MQRLPLSPDPLGRSPPRSTVTTIDVCTTMPPQRPFFSSIIVNPVDLEKIVTRLRRLQARHGRMNADDLWLDENEPRM